MTNKTEQEKYIDLLTAINKAQTAEISTLRQNLDTLGGSYDKTLNFKPEEPLSYFKEDPSEPGMGIVLIV